MIDISIPLLYRRSHLFGHRFRHRRALGLACSKAPRWNHQSLRSHPPSETRPCMTSSAPCLMSPAISLPKGRGRRWARLPTYPDPDTVTSEGAGRCTTVPACQCRTNPLDIHRLPVCLSNNLIQPNQSEQTYSTPSITLHCHFHDTRHVLDNTLCFRVQDKPRQDICRQAHRICHSQPPIHYLTYSTTYSHSRHFTLLRHFTARLSPATYVPYHSPNSSQLSLRYFKPRTALSHRKISPQPHDSPFEHGFARLHPRRILSVRIPPEPRRQYGRL